MSFTRFGARSPETERRRTWKRRRSIRCRGGGATFAGLRRKASDHHGAELRGVDVVRRNGSHDAAEAEHRDSIGNSQDIFQLVADKGACRPLGPRGCGEFARASSPLQPRKKRCWLVEMRMRGLPISVLISSTCSLFADGEPFDLDGAVERQAVPL